MSTNQSLAREIKLPMCNLVKQFGREAKLVPLNFKRMLRAKGKLLSLRQILYLGKKYKRKILDIEK